MEDVAAQLGRIADAHDRVATALEQIAGACTAVAASYAIDRFWESSRDDYGANAREYLHRWHQGLKEKESAR